MAEMPKTVRLIDKNGDLWFPVGHLGTEYIRADLVDELVKAAEEAREAVKITECPRPISGPDDMEAQACVAAGECGCCYGVALAKIDAALTHIDALKEK